jgi:hypothetical protein
MQTASNDNGQTDAQRAFQDAHPNNQSDVFPVWTDVDQEASKQRLAKLLDETMRSRR